MKKSHFWLCRIFLLQLQEYICCNTSHTQNHSMLNKVIHFLLFLPISWQVFYPQRAEDSILKPAPQFISHLNFASFVTIFVLWVFSLPRLAFAFYVLQNISLMMWDHRTTHFRPWKIIICLIFRKHVIHLVRGENLIALKSWNSRLDSPLRAVWKACLYLYSCKRYRSMWGAEIFDRQEKVKAHRSQNQDENFVLFWGKSSSHKDSNGLYQSDIKMK